MSAINDIEVYIYLGVWMLLIWPARQMFSRDFDNSNAIIDQLLSALLGMLIAALWPLAVPVAISWVVWHKVLRLNKNGSDS